MKDLKLNPEEKDKANRQKGKEQRTRKAKLVQTKIKYKHARHWLEEEDEDDERYIPFYLKEEEEE